VFELPEMITLASQMNETLAGRIVRSGGLGNSPHKFVWYNRSEDEFNQLTQGKQFGKAYARGRWLFAPLEPGYVLLLGECGGSILYHQPGATLPKKYHLRLIFDDDSFLTATTQMWGAYELYEAGREQERDYVREMRTTPVEPGFTVDYLSTLIDTAAAEQKRSVKGLLTQDQLIPGLGNAIAQDIMFQARLYPKRPIDTLTAEERRALYASIVETVNQVIAGGGRYDETDLYGNPGGYVRLMDKNSVGQPCPECGTPIEKMSYLGGTCYYCPACQS
jgi:formamidopyrimidine-DNA glycosylase